MRAFLAVLGTIFAVAYPAAVYFGLTHFGTRQLTVLLATLIAIGALLKLPSAGRAHALAALKGPALLLPLFGLSFVLDDARFLFAMPVLINVILLGSFAASLRTELPIVERFARMQVRDLSDAEVRYCRAVTRVWCVFFAVNGLIALLLAWLAPVGWWAAYTGAIAYVLIGVIGGAEYLIRKSRFGRFGTGPIDRMLQSVLPRSKVSS
jgi:uncharacterized membrane protein